jgi:peptidoglycan/LPS O-acetylase OafA/YrhL
MLGGSAAVALISLLIGSFDNESGVMQTVGYTCVAFAFGGLLLVVLSCKPANDAFSNPLMCWFGRYSYGLYVWHPIINVILFYTPVRAAMGVEGSTAGVLYLLSAFVISLGVSLASYHLVELPFLRLKRRFSESSRRHLNLPSLSRRSPNR